MGQTPRKVRQRLGDILSIEHFCLSMRRLVPEICGVECGSYEKMVIWCFAPPNLGKGPQFFFFGGGEGAFVNWHYYRLAGHVWLRSHNWSFIYPSQIKKSAVKYNGLDFGGHNYIIITFCTNVPPLLNVTSGEVPIAYREQAVHRPYWLLSCSPRRVYIGENCWQVRAS